MILMTKHIDKLLKYKTATGIANYLYRNGIKGIPNDASTCPIAQAIALDYPDHAITVSSVIVKIYKTKTIKNGDIQQFITSTPAMAQFIRGFDDSSYSELRELQIGEDSNVS